VLEYIDGSTLIGVDRIAFKQLTPSFTIENSILFNSRVLVRLMSNAIHSVVVVQNILRLGAFCFADCFNLHKVMFEEDSVLKEIGPWAFFETSVTVTTIPRRVELIGTSCFANCRSLQAVHFGFPSRLRIIEDGTFSSSSIHMMAIPASVEIIGAGCFSNCGSLKDI
jgi:hypothetical protein